MKSYTIPLKPTKGADYVEIIVFCCLHIGHKAHDRKRAIQWRDWGLSSPNRWFMNLGDDTENAVPGDEEHNSMMWDSDMHPEDQYRHAADFWTPVVEQRRLLINHNSNHWWRSEAKTGISIPKNLNVFLQGLTQRTPAQSPLPDALPRWGGWQALTDIRVGKHSYMTHSWHGAGGSATPEGALRKCRSMAVNVEADLFFCGHFHQKIAWSDNYLVHAGNGMNALERQRMFVCTGGFLGWHGTYAERKGYPPNRRGAMVVRLGVREWDVKVSI